MDAIFSYLDNMFAHLPKTEEVKRAKSELGQMMEDKYNQLRAEGRSDNEAVGQVISEFGNLSELAAELGISNQYQQASSDDNFVTVSDAEAESFIEKNQKVCQIHRWWYYLGLVWGGDFRYFLFRLCGRSVQSRSFAGR